MAKKDKDQGVFEFVVGMDDVLPENPVDTHPADLDATGEDITVPAVYQPAVEMSGDDFFIPRVRLAQGLTAEVQEGMAKTGDWLMMGIEPQTSLIIVPLSMAKQQEFRHTDTGLTQCYSNDAITGIGDPGGPCADCPLNKWGPRGDNGRGTPPLCMFRYAYMVYVYTDKDGVITPIGPGMFEAKKSSIQLGKVINSFAMMHKGWGNFAVRLTSRKVEDGQKKYARPVATAAKIPPELLVEAQTMRDVLKKGVRITTDDSEVGDE